MGRRRKTPPFIQGQQFNSWTVISDELSINRHVHLLCRCKCSYEGVIAGFSLVTGKSKQCTRCALRGHPPNGRRHGLSRTKEYFAWSQMKSRCLNPAHNNWADYGGRGIRVHEPWANSFTAFLDDVGHAPSQRMTLDRINNDGHYEPGNCRWATYLQQEQNKRTSRFYDVRGEKMTIRDMSARFSVNPVTLYARLNYLGWSIERATQWAPSVTSSQA